MPREMINGCEYVPGEELEEWEQDEVYDALTSGNMQIAHSKPLPRHLKKSHSK